MKCCRVDVLGWVKHSQIELNSIEIEEDPTKSYEIFFINEIKIDWFDGFISKNSLHFQMVQTVSLSVDALKWFDTLDKNSECQKLLKPLSQPKIRFRLNTSKFIYFVRKSCLHSLANKINWLGLKFERSKRKNMLQIHLLKVYFARKKSEISHYACCVMLSTLAQSARRFYTAFSFFFC